MALTESIDLPLGTYAPNFQLKDFDGVSYWYDFIRDCKVKLVMFICNHCPYVKHIQVELAELCQTLKSSGLGELAINSNDAKSYPLDGPTYMKEGWEKFNYAFPYLIDESGEEAKSFIWKA